jgi:hypothetical protein
VQRLPHPSQIKGGSHKVSLYCKHQPSMDCYLSEQQIEELANFDYQEDLSDLIEEEKFNINDYLNSNIDY